MLLDYSECSPFILALASLILSMSLSYTLYPSLLIMPKSLVIFERLNFYDILGLVVELVCVSYNNLRISKDCLWLLRDDWGLEVEACSSKDLLRREFFTEEVLALKRLRCLVYILISWFMWMFLWFTWKNIKVKGSTFFVKSFPVFYLTT